jgi:hypothetical protein
MENQGKQFDRFIDAMLAAPGMRDMVGELNFLCEQLKDVLVEDRIGFHDKLLETLGIRTTDINAASPEEIFSIIQAAIETIGDCREKKEKDISEVIQSWEAAGKPALFHFQFDERSYFIIKNKDGSYSLVFLEDNGFPLREVKPGDPILFPLGDRIDY